MAGDEARDELDVDVLGRVRVDRRSFIKRLVVGTVFAVPAIQSLDLGGLSVASAQLQCGLQNALHVTSSPNPSSVGQPVTLTATQTGSSRVASPTIDPSDFVEFFDGTASLGRVDYSANPTSLVVSTLTVGNHPITAFYSGTTASPGFCPITSDPVTQVVNAAYPLAADPLDMGQGAMPADVEPTAATGGTETSPVPAAMVAGSGLAVAAAIAYRRSRPTAEDL